MAEAAVKRLDLRELLLALEARVGVDAAARVDGEVGAQGGYSPELRTARPAVDVDPDYAARAGGGLARLGEGAGQRGEEQLLPAPPGTGRRPDQGPAAPGRRVVRALAPRAHPQLARLVAVAKHELDQAPWPPSTSSQ
jgi:hypothetical protein